MARKKRSQEDQADYQVGYMRPPKEHQFKPGHSGNPKGRPKGIKSTQTIVRELLDEIVEVNENGKRKRMTRRELMIRGLFLKAAKGDFRVANAILELDQGAQRADGFGVTHGVLVVPGESKSAAEWAAEFENMRAPSSEE